VTFVNLAKTIAHAELGQGDRLVGKPEQPFNDMNEFSISSQHGVVIVKLGTHGEQSYT
jgi:hypothetical protein